MSDVSVTKPVEDRLVLPLELRPAQTLGLSGLTYGFLVAGALMAGAILFHVGLSGTEAARVPTPPGLGFATRVALVSSLTIGYALAVWCFMGRWVSADLAELGVAPYAPNAVPPERLRRSRRAGLAGMVFFVCLIEVPSALAGAPLGSAWTSLHPLSYMLGLGLLFFWLAGRLASMTLGLPSFQSFGDQLEIDLLDRGLLRVFGRIALRGALIWVIGMSIASLAFVNPELRFADSLVVLVPILIVTLAIAGLALLLPVQGLHRRLVAAKRLELERVEAAIRGEPGALQGSRIAARGEPTSLADLIAYRGLIESTPTWPFDVATLRRLGLYLLIPLGSWVGGALVERAVGTLFD